MADEAVRTEVLQWGQRQSPGREPGGDEVPQKLKLLKLFAHVHICTQHFEEWLQEMRV